MAQPAVVRSLRDVTEFIESAVRYGLPAPNSASATRWGDIDIQVQDIAAWASYCDDAEPALSKAGTLVEFQWTDDDGIRFNIYASAPKLVEDLR